MKILSFDSSAKSAAVGISEDGAIVSEVFSNTGLTHSETLMPMIDFALKSASLSPTELDYIAVTCGPGSFTGLRIGIAAAKGLSDGLHIPCIPLSTLEVLAFGCSELCGLLLPVMDARRSQVYTATFDNDTGLKRRTDDRVMSIDALFSEVKETEKDIFLVGDGAELCYNTFGILSNVKVVPETLRYPKGSALLTAAQKNIKRAIAGTDLRPSYLRLPQAERELLKRENNR